MCCLVEKEMPEKSRRVYSGGFLPSFNPKKFQRKAEEYISDITPGIVHGKLVDIREYFVSGHKRSVRFVSVPATGIAREFQTLASQWKKETGFHSSLSEKFTHPAYQRIMAMGKPALPFILRDLRNALDHWFYALQFIAGNEGKNVALGAANLDAARDAWLEWGYKHGYL
jgi:hypothetical protein